MLRSQIMSAIRFQQLQDLEKEINWGKLVEAIHPHYTASKIRHLCVTAESMLRIYFLQQRYGLSPSGVEEALFQVDAFREFSLIDLDSGVIPNASCIEDFHLLLLEKSLASKIQMAFNINIQPILTETEWKINKII